MEKYEKPNMEVVELEKDVITASVCVGGTPDQNEGPDGVEF